MSAAGEIRVVDGTPAFAQVPLSLMRVPGHRPIHLAMYAALMGVANWTTRVAGIHGEPPTRDLVKQLAGFTRNEQFYGARSWLVRNGFLQVQDVPGSAPIYTLLGGPVGVAGGPVANRDTAPVANRDAPGVANRDTNSEGLSDSSRTPLPPAGSHRSARPTSATAGGSPTAGRTVLTAAVLAGYLPTERQRRDLLESSDTRVAELDDVLLQLQDAGWTPKQLREELLRGASRAEVPVVWLLAVARRLLSRPVPVVTVQPSLLDAEAMARLEHDQELRDRLDVADEILAGMDTRHVVQLQEIAAAQVVQELGPASPALRGATTSRMRHLALDSVPFGPQMARLRERGRALRAVPVASDHSAHTALSAAHRAAERVSAGQEDAE